MKKSTVSLASEWGEGRYQKKLSMNTDRHHPLRSAADKNIQLLSGTLSLAPQDQHMQNRILCPYALSVLCLLFYLLNCHTGN